MSSFPITFKIASKDVVVVVTVNMSVTVANLSGVADFVLVRLTFKMNTVVFF
jgi:hypothetical protein